MARREKKPVHRVEMTEGKRNIIRQLLQTVSIVLRKFKNPLAAIEFVKARLNQP